MANQTLVVREATIPDAPAISDLLHEFNGEALPPKDLARRMEEAQGLEAVFLGELNGELTGLLVLRTVPTISDPEDWAEIAELFVRPEHRRAGVGRALIEAAAEYACSRGCVEMHLLVDPKNAPALAFYQKIGFLQDSWEMRRRL